MFYSSTILVEQLFGTQASSCYTTISITQRIRGKIIRECKRHNAIYLLMKCQRNEFHEISTTREHRTQEPENKSVHISGMASFNTCAPFDRCLLFSESKLHSNQVFSADVTGAELLHVVDMHLAAIFTLSAWQLHYNTLPVSAFDYWPNHPDPFFY